MMKHDILGDIDLNFTVSEVETTVEEKDGIKRVRVGGIALKPGKSRNGNVWEVEHVKTNAGKEVKFFMQPHETLEPLAVKNVVGKVALIQEGDNLRYDGIIRNTKEHPEVVEHAIEKEIEVSVDARVEKIHRIIEGDNKIKYILTNPEIRALCGVGIGGIKGNSMDYAVAEQFSKFEHGNNHILEEEKRKKQLEAKQMDEVKKLEQTITELEGKLKGMSDEKAEMEKEQEQKKVEEKEAMVKEILEVNKELVEAELKIKSMSELLIIKEYEAKLNKSTEGEGENDEGNGEVEPTEDDKALESEMKNIVIEKESGTVTMNDAGYKRFQDEIKKNI